MLLRLYIRVYIYIYILLLIYILLYILYYCMPNMSFSSIISSLNKHTLRAWRSWSYEEGDVHNITDNIARSYVGATSTTWKERKGVHNQGINHRELSNRCELTKYIWTLKDADKQFCIRWRILERVKGRTIGGECKLCVAEKLHIISHPQRDLLLNSKTSIQCPHKIKNSLSSLHVNRGRPRGRANRRGNHGNRETIA